MEQEVEQEVVSLIECLATIPDPRKPRGVRHPFVGMLVIALIGLMARQVDLVAIIDYFAEHWTTLGPRLGFKPWFGLPHPTTLSRLLARVPLAVLQPAYQRWLAQLIADLPLVAAVDGKYPHQSRDGEGLPFGILTVFAHDLKLCLAQWVVSDHEAEPSVLKAHLEELFVQYPNLKALTMDAIFAQRGLCQLLVDLKRGYMLRIKGNQPNVAAALIETFAEAPQRRPDAQSVDKRDGCVETRRLWLDQEVARYAASELGFPGAQQAGRLDKRILHLDTGEVKTETWYLVNYEPTGPLSPTEFLARVRGHWGIENSLHHVKDRSWGEDKHTLRRPGLAACFSVLLNVALSVLRRPGQFAPTLSMPRRARRCRAQPEFALSLIASP
jgi:hypothetical protein